MIGSLLRPRTIRQKINQLLAATTLLALAMSGIALGIIDLRTHLQAVKQDLATQADVIALTSAASLEFDDPRVAAENLAALRAKPDVASAAVYDARGVRFASYGTHEPDSGGTARAKGGTQTDWQMVRVWRPVVSNRERVGTVYLEARHELLGHALGDAAVLSLVLGASFIAALLLSNKLQRAITGPIQAMGGVARRVQEGDGYDMRVERASDDEIGELADAFNAMLAELQRRAQTLETANEQLRASDARYQLAVRGSSAGLWDWDMRAGTMFHSPRFKALLGYSTEEFPDLPTSIDRVMHDEDRPVVREALRRHLADDAPFQTECRLAMRSGEWLWFLVTGMSQKDAAGQAFRMAGSLIDVTERKRAEQVLQEANRAKDEFLATLAHELRNPLAPIRTGLEILKKDGGNGAASARARATMERQLAHMIRLIDDLLDISRISRGKIRLDKSRVPLAVAIESAIEIGRPVIEARGHVLEVDLVDPDIVLMADGTRIAQALGNLVNNAAKYTPPGGRIAVRAWQEDSTAVVEIEDSGVGIPPELLDQVFELFMQVGRTLDSAQGGLGIGLYLVRSLVHLHGGTVVAQSRGPGLGSTFTVRLPCLQGVDREETQVIAHDPPRKGASRILVVDDNVDAADTLATILEMTGREARVVNEGAKVLEAAREFRPEIVLLDIGLPGMSGHEVARVLRQDELLGRTVLVAVTGWGSEADRQRSRDAGFDAHLTKPVDLAQLEPILQGTHPGRDSPYRGK